MTRTRRSLLNVGKEEKLMDAVGRLYLPVRFTNVIKRQFGR